MTEKRRVYLECLNPIRGCIQRCNPVLLSGSRLDGQRRIREAAVCGGYGRRRSAASMGGGSRRSAGRGDYSVILFWLA
nr:hypothetical protein Itr_chr06CG14130 [Ipomoea trifida]GMD06139.1 hypothetical protein Iba_chr06bCG13120 [Ipomoea batatas]